ncbi:bifunctional biotin--[acetyl-CoA-carboxylase] ligase/biotin operon repressor BirA [Testudinibacter sp. P80/BLE/0925]|uniref:bifunctional biotin--[acetyl-CoA-carboxylase] ligase/biotin operon repressor BirA n=1 Tax=Testudinibacter sp. TW-1 TaxID=3417757 RepID=UPI003D3641AD
MTEQAQLESVLTLLADGKPHLLPAMNAPQRAAVLHQLQTWGLNVRCSADQVYQLSEPLNLLDQAAINRRLTYGTALVLRSVDSTNEFLLQRKTLPSGTICTAERQTAGRGRRGRQWHSPFAQNLYFSLLWHFRQPAERLQALSLVIGICLADTLSELGVENISIKWPNDIYFDGRKLGGILIESRAFAAQKQALVMGIGLNLSMRPADGAAIEQAWANLNESAVRIERNQLVATLANNLQHVLLQVEQHGVTPYLQRWQQYDHFYQKPIKLLLPNTELHGIGQGIDSDSGELLLQTADGQLQRFHIGEISVRPLG